MDPTEAAVNDTLRFIRGLADASTTRILDNGRVAAKITLPLGERSFNRYVADKCGLSQATVSARVGWLVKAGLIDPGSRGNIGGDRWVCVEGVFSYKM